MIRPFLLALVLGVTLAAAGLAVGILRGPDTSDRRMQTTSECREFTNGQGGGWVCIHGSR